MVICIKSNVSPMWPCLVIMFMFKCHIFKVFKTFFMSVFYAIKTKCYIYKILNSIYNPLLEDDFNRITCGLFVNMPVYSNCIFAVICSPPLLLLAIWVVEKKIHSSTTEFNMYVWRILLCCSHEFTHMDSLNSKDLFS